MCQWVHCLAVITIVSVVAGDTSPCNVAARTDAGWVCGLARWGEKGSMYASFRGIPYAKQPVGELRFQELKPVEPWTDYLDATEEGPVCPQTDVFYGRIMRPHEISEACIYANVHVPIEALPPSDQKPALPIIVFIHGGGFAFGSGDTDLHGPEYMVTENVIVITFNYRLNVFGFMSLEPVIPGNNGLRDMVTLLKWVQRNAKAFGGNPDDVTLMGQSAGAAAAHLLTLSKAAEGLFKRVILMSGTAISPFFSTSPSFSQTLTKTFLLILGINTTDPKEIHKKLLEMPEETLMKANGVLLDQIGLTTFVPVVETPHSELTTIIDDNPEVLLANGRGKDIPLIIGFTDSECHTFQRRLEQINIVSRMKAAPTLMVPLDIIYSSDVQTIASVADRIQQEYFNGTIDLEGYINLCSDSYYKYPALRLAEKQAAADKAPVYVYQFSYNSPDNPFREVNGLPFNGAGHVEDLTYVFRVNSMLGTHFSFPPTNKDDEMKCWMTSFVSNFVKCSAPICNDPKSWEPVTQNDLQYQNIEIPNVVQQRHLTGQLKDMKVFFDDLHQSDLSADSTV